MHKHRDSRQVNGDYNKLVRGTFEVVLILVALFGIRPVGDFLVQSLIACL